MRAGTTIAALQAELSLLTRRRRAQLLAARRAQRQADKARAEAEDLDRRMREVRLDMIQVRVERGEVQRLQPGMERHVHGA